jgi:hypothetical protein
MKKFVAAFAAVLTSAVLIGGTADAAFAQTGAAYRLTPVSAVSAAETVIANETLWKRVGDNYIAKQSNSRPAIVCAQAVKKIGKVQSFEANGQAFDEAALAKCNEKAR